MNEHHDEANADALAFTGERYVPEGQGVHGDTMLEHLHRYLFACNAATGKSVLDIASGEGYGSSMLARTARSVIGVDISAEAVSHAQRKYSAGNLHYLSGSCGKIPLADGSVDLVVSFETIEHHDDHATMIREIKRVLRPDGVLIISSPDKLEYSDKPGYSNQYHVKELYRSEFTELLSGFFKNQSIYGQRVVHGSAIFCEDSSSPLESFASTDDKAASIPGVACPVYLVAVASDGELPCLVSGMLEQPLSEADMVKGLAGGIAERDLQIAELQRQLAVRDTQIHELKQRTLLLADKDKRINDLVASVSWRITAPLRKMAALFKRE